MSARPKIGIGVFIVKDCKILFGYRESEHGRGTWSAFGGHLEYGESPAECAIRETAEETGLKIADPQLFGVTNDFFKESGKHYVTLLMVAQPTGGKLKVHEPDKIKDFAWRAPYDIPSPLFLVLKNMIAKEADIMHKIAHYFDDPTATSPFLLR